MKRIGDVFWLTAAKLVALIMQVLAVRVYFQTLGDQGYGVLVYFTTVMGYVILVDVGLISALQREVIDCWAKGQMSQIAGLARQTARYVSLAYVLGVAIYAGLAVALPFPFRDIHSGNLWPFAALASVHLAGNLAFLFFTAILASVSEFRRMSVATLLSGFLVPLLGMAGAFAWGTQEAVIGGTAAGFLLAAIVAGVQTRPWWSAAAPEPTDRAEVRRQLFGVGLRSYAAKLAAQFATSIDRVIIANVQSGVLTGYALCAQIAQTFQELLVPAYQTMFPAVSRAVVNQEPDRAETIEKYIVAGAALASSFTLVCCGFADPLIRVWVGTEVLGSAAVTLWLGAFKCFEFATNITGIVHFALGRMERLVPISAANAILTATLTAVALRTWGIVGVGAMNAVLSFVLFLPLIVSVRRHAAPDLSLVRVVARCLASVAMGGLFGVGAALLGAQIDSTTLAAVWLLAAPVAAVLCFVAQVKILRVPLPSRLAERLPKLARLLGEKPSVRATRID